MTLANVHLVGLLVHFHASSFLHVRSRKALEQYLFRKFLHHIQREESNASEDDAESLPKGNCSCRTSVMLFFFSLTFLG